MGLMAVAEAVEQMDRKQAVLSETDKEFVCQFAFATGDKELTDRLIDELMAEGADKGEVLGKYSAVKGFQQDCIERIENILVALEMYRMQEEKAVQTLTELLAAYGADITVEELKEMPEEEVREHFKGQEEKAR